MIIDKNIRIENIYYMLAYAFSVLRNTEFKNIATTQFDNVADLLSAILVKGVTMQIKRGLSKEYISKTEPLSLIRGKIDIIHSMKEQFKHKKQLVCTHDDFSINTLHHKIIKTAMLLLFKLDINKERKSELKKLLNYFQDVDMVNPYAINWNMRFHRNNASYQMLMGICQLVIKGLLQKDENGDMKLQNFLDEQSMCKLYEKFILEYYKKEYPTLSVSSSQIKWTVDTTNNNYLNLLPKMQSDVVITNKLTNKMLIIDAKYYGKILQKSFYDKQTLRSNNLYQIFTYVKNADINNMNVAGMLLYAKTEEEISPKSEFNMDGNMIYIRSLDLSNKFTTIEAQLKEVLIISELVSRWDI